MGGGVGWSDGVLCCVVWCGVVWCAEGAVTKWQWPGWSCIRVMQAGSSRPGLCASGPLSGIDEAGGGVVWCGVMWCGVVCARAFRWRWCGAAVQ